MSDDKILADINGDGFTDLAYVADGYLHVRYGKWNGQLGPDQATETPDVSQFQLEGDRYRDAKKGDMHPVAPLIRWIAPYNGNAILTGMMSKQAQGGDGVVANIYYRPSGGDSSQVLWSRTVTSGDTTTCVPSGDLASCRNTTCSACGNGLILNNLSAGDEFYFLLDGRDDTEADTSTWNPQITYQVDSAKQALKEPTGESIYAFSQANDFQLSGEPGGVWKADAKGTVEVSWTLTKWTTNDDLNLSVTKTHTENDTKTTEDKWHAGYCADCTPQDESHTQQFDVLPGDELSFKVFSDMPIDPNRVDWKPQVRYKIYYRSDPDAGTVYGQVDCGPNPTDACVIEGDPDPGFAIPQQIVVQKPQVYFPARNLSFASGPTKVFVVTQGGTFHLGGPANSYGGLAYIQGINRLYKKVKVTGMQGADVSADVTLAAGDQVFFTVVGDSYNASWDASVGSTHAQVNFRDVDPYYQPNGGNVMSGGAHQWSYGDWNTKTPFDAKLIKTPSGSNPAYMFVLPSEQGTPALERAWIGRAARFYIGKGVLNPGLSAGGSALQGGSSLTALRAGENVSWDFSVNVLGGTYGYNSGESESSLDLIDINGDRYPDLVGRNTVRLNNGDGTFGPYLSLNLDGSLRHTDMKNIRLGAGFELRTPSDDDRLVNYTSSDSRVSTVFASQFGINKDFGTSTGTLDLVDMNGDGLVDQVKNASDGFAVRLNLGGQFSNWISWPTSANWSAPYSFPSSISHHDGLDTPNNNVLRLDDVGADSVGLAGSVGNGSYGIGGGGGWVHNVSRTTTTLVDINGDGLPDHVMKLGGVPGEENTLHVKLNQGTSFAAEEPWTLPSWSVTDFGRSHFLAVDDALAFQRAKSWNGSFNATFCYYIFCATISVFYVNGHGWSYAAMEDVNGDGLADHVLKLDGDPHLYFKQNQLGEVNLLTKVTRPLGGAIELGYSQYGNHVGDPTANPRVDMPRTQWALSKVRVTDGRGNGYSNYFNYSDGPRGTKDPIQKLGSGFYDRAERENYGYSHVVTTRGFYIIPDGTVGGWMEGDGSVLEQFYMNQDYYRKGLLSEEYEIRGDGSVMRGGRVSYAAPTDLPARTSWFAPLESSRSTLFLEGRSTNIHDPALKYHNESRAYDTEGNLTDLWDDGDNQGDTGDHKGPDNVHYTIGYYTETNTHITRANSIVAADSSGNTLRSRGATYDVGKGTLKTLTNYIYGGKDPSSKNVRNGVASTHNYTYDNYGNMHTHTDPNNYVLTYTYDSTAQTYRTDVVDSFGYHSKATPNFKFGTNADTTDVNGQKESYVYDDFGRLSQVFGPNDQGGSTPTIAMTYSADAAPPFARTQHLDVQHSGDTIDTVTFIDGLGRVIQTKKDLDYDDGTGTVQMGMSVSGLVTFDSRGRVASQGQPVFDTGPTTSFVTVPGKNSTKYSYDTLGRTTKVVGPDGATTTTEYWLATLVGGLWLATYVKDPIGNASDGKTNGLGERQTFSDVNGRPIAVVEYNNYDTATLPLLLVTQYSYNPMGELVKVIDAKSNETTATYDTVGQMVALTSPDAGKAEYLFDLAGNLGAKQTSVLAGQSKYVTYDYDWNRLKKINYPSMPAVTYEYGSSSESGDGKGNIAGRVKKVTMEGGSETRTYDKMGNVNQTVTTLKHLQQTSLPDQTFTMQFSYDSFGRMQTMTYPNWVKDDYTNLAGPGELVTYKYDHGGNLDSISGYMQTQNPSRPKEQERDFKYLNHMTYDEFEQRRVMESGNGIANKYGYYEDTRRLKTVYAAALGPQERQLGKPASPFHNMTYYYDLVGNIKKVENATTAYIWQYDGVHTGPKRMEYTYDNLYQLKSATGKYRQKFDHGYTYASTFQYDEIGNLTKKSQLENRIVWEDMSSVQEGLAGLEGERSRPDGPLESLSYTLDYKYTGTRPHAVSTITETSSNGNKNDHVYGYDNNGNNAGNTYQGATRVLTWDEENRLKQVTESGTALGKFLYSPDGERTHKQTAAGDSLYVNQFYAYQPNKVATKHIFAGETRIASKNEIYSDYPTILYYHPDHLGSTSFVSMGSASGSYDRNQMLVQHEGYFPFGEREFGGNQEECDLSRPNGLRREWTFNSKEFDVDTGLYYYGARYYDPRTSVWQSADPALAQYMRGKHSGGVFEPRNLGLYSYAWNNPEVMHDPDGGIVRLVPVTKGTTPTAAEIKRFQDQYDKAKNYLGAGSKIEALEKLPQIVEIRETIKKDNVDYDSSKRVMRWNPKSALRTTSGGTQSPALGLDHEADHAVQHLKNPGKFAHDTSPAGALPGYDNMEERRVIQGSEKSNAIRLGEGVRTNHGGTSYKVSDSDKR
jgi:RHS repeat-associated protein